MADPRSLGSRLQRSPRTLPEADMIRAFGAIAVSFLLAPTAPFSFSPGQRPRKTGDKVSTSAESAIQTPLGGAGAHIADRRYVPAFGASPHRREAMLYGV
jgi:hypothetical protein